MGGCGWVYSRIHTFDWLVSFCCLIDGKWTMGGGACSYNGVLVYSSVFFFSGGSINKGCNFPPMKRQVGLRGGVQQKSANQKKQKKLTKNTKLREKNQRN